MRVYFDMSLFDAGQEAHEMEESGDTQAEESPCGCIIPIQAEFMAMGRRRVIPVIYCFTQGIVFDILTIMDVNLMNTYFDKYSRWEKETDTKSEARIHRMMQDNPFQEVEIKEVWLNGHHCEGGVSYSSVGYISGRIEEEKISAVIKEGYPEYLENAECFFCQRFCVRTDRDYTREVITDMRLKTRRQCRMEFFDLGAEVNPGEEKVVSFIHPVTGRKHQIFFYDIEQTIFSLAESELSVYTGTAEAVPHLPEGERLRFDDSLSYKRNEREGEQSAGAVTVIGTAVGPTSIFIAGKETEERRVRYGGQQIPCFSKPYWSNEKGKSMFHITGLERTMKEEEIIQVFG